MRGSRNFRQGGPGQSDKKSSDALTFVFFLVLSLFYRSQIRALTRILKTGVQDSHLAKSRSPTGKSGSPTQKKLESHQFVYTVYLFHFSRKWYIWIIFRLTDFNPISINGLFLLNKTKYFVIFFHVTSTHIFFVWPYQNKRLNCWYLSYSLTRQTDRQERQTDSSPLMHMEVVVFFLIKTHLASVYADCNE